MQVACCFRQRVVCIFRAQHCRRQVQILANSREPQSRDVSGDSRAAGQRNTGNCSTDSSTVRGVARFSFTCPACSQRIHRLSILQRHLHNCCPDLVPAQAWKHTKDDREAIALLLAEANEAEFRLRKACIDTAFRQIDDDGNQIKLSLEEVADVMQLPAERVRQAFRMAQKAMPLVGDPEPVEVIYEDDDIIAVNKPPNVISAPKHRYKGGSMVNRLITYLGYPPSPVHRLDMMTSGVLMMAKHHEAASCLGQEFGRRSVKKAYLAIVTGAPDEKQFSVSLPIGRHPTEKIARATVADGDSAHTDFIVVASNPEADLGQCSPGLVATEQMYKLRGAALVVAKPITGRTHQIRLHLAAAGHGIVGDEVYGLQSAWISRQALHAASLTIQHPASKQPLQLTAGLPEDMVSALQVLRIASPAAHDLQALLDS